MITSVRNGDPNAAILGVGIGIPPFRVDSVSSAKFAAKMACADTAQSRKVSALYRRSGIVRRGSVLLEDQPEDGQEVESEFYPPAASDLDRGPSTKHRSDRYATEAPILANRAAAAALTNSRVDADQITHLVTVSCTGFSAPGIDIALIDGLGLPRTTERVQVGFMGCHGAINGLRAARGLVAADSDARVLLCSVELCSLHYQYGMQADRIVSNALFADGSAAAVVGSGIASSGVGTVDATGSYLVPESRDAMTWNIGDHGYEMTLSAQVPSLIEGHLRSFLSEWLGEQGETIESIGGWAVHPGGTRILSAVETALNLPDQALAVPRAVLGDHGNMSSATMLFILDRFLASSQPKPWLMLGFGPGLEVEVALIR